MFQTLFPNVVDMKTEFIEAIWQTIYMTLASAFFAGILGLATGILLVITEEGGIAENKPLYGFIDKLVNLLRSVPFIILLAVISPLTILIVGTSVGTTAAIVPLVFGIFPFYARQIQTALLTVDRGVIEAAESVGSSPFEIIFRVYLREGLAEIIRTSTITVISLIGLTTMAGAIGSGGLGDIAISIGYARYENDITLAATLVILIMVFSSRSSVTFWSSLSKIITNSNLKPKHFSDLPQAQQSFCCLFLDYQAANRPVPTIQRRSSSDRPIPTIRFGNTLLKAMPQRSSTCI